MGRRINGVWRDSLNKCFSGLKMQEDNSIGIYHIRYAF